MTGYDNWDDERARLLRGQSEDVAARAGASLDAAASAARAGNLRQAARHLEDVRATLVALDNFRRHDDDILVFSSLIRLIRGMSSETQVPAEYQRFVDAIPSLRYDEEMSRAQRAFWYGSANAVVGGQIGLVPRNGAAPRSDETDWGQVGASAVVVAAIAAAIYFFS